MLQDLKVKSHPGIIAALVVVASLALMAAVFIVKKYCFTESNVTYRYSVLRAYQEIDDLDHSTTNRLRSDDSDEDLLD
ncbi:sortilin-like isoform X2 [Microcaecilia unicolor]|uniref:Sortilin-like isoform X2 n=1 Tax=Microcaecilia unicolor TaxID=1415580 RepID=A0A6P7YAN4_9AMPH|nr:sortilin-like isoform X2 [Microcaecilia unicolor]